MYSVHKCVGRVYKIILLFTIIEATQIGIIPCLENGRFYRNPETSLGYVKNEDECSMYFLCLEGEVFEFRCSSGLVFDVEKQICDVQKNVENCQLISEEVIQKPNIFNCEDNYLSCKNGTCIPDDYFCDGSIDCIDSSDEIDCDLIKDKFLAKLCNADCELPGCFCSIDGTKIPGNLPPQEVPQIILITFEGPINHDNFDLYTKTLFHQDILNPNGCPIKATFFVNHFNNNYYQTQLLWNYGHEIALNSITNKNSKNWWSNNASLIDYFDEIIGQANMLNKFSKIRAKNLLGMRVPHLKIGGEKQFLMMKEFGLLYDNSIIAPFQDPPLWPYTLQFKIPHNCSNNQNCPLRSYPGVWEIILNKFIVNKTTCTYINDCSKDLDLYKILITNFNRHYLTNRAPFGIHFKSDWFRNENNLIAIQKFIENMMVYQDVWFLTNSEAVEWIRNPLPLSKLKTSDVWNCDDDVDMERLKKYSEMVCDKPNVCKVFSSIFQEEKLMYTCEDCPEVYPWIKNEFGKKDFD
nr:uncharacterized protein LOC111426454 isoform X1 [Onthophagus taurus]